MPGCRMTPSFSPCSENQTMEASNQCLEKEESRIQDNLGKMAGITRTELEGALMALEAQDADQAQRVVNSDVDLNNLHRIVERECLEVLALQQPVARDLREVVGSLQVAGELDASATTPRMWPRSCCRWMQAIFRAPWNRSHAWATSC